MKRLLCIIALAAMILIPDWASACWPQWGMPAYQRTYCVPVYHAPVYCPPPVYCQPVYPQPIFVQPWVPVPSPTLQPPRVQSANTKSDHSRTRPSSPDGRKAAEGTHQQNGEHPVDSHPKVARPEPAPAQPPQIESIRPASGVTTPPTTKPQPDPTPKEPKRGGIFDIPPSVKPDDNVPPVGKPQINEPRLPPLGQTNLPDTDPKLPPLELPKDKANTGLPPLELPKDSEIKIPALELPRVPSADPHKTSPELSGHSTAVPVPAPSPDVLTPPSDTSPSKKLDSLPPLTLPPDTPVAPNQPVEARSSPLSSLGRGLKVNVFPASGTVTADGLHKIGFFNHTNRDLQLTIEGKTVKLPAKSYLHAQLPSTFTWKCANQPATRASIPANATGLDVLIRE